MLYLPFSYMSNILSCLSKYHFYVSWWVHPTASNLFNLFRMFPNFFKIYEKLNVSGQIDVNLSGRSFPFITYPLNPNLKSIYISHWQTDQSSQIDPKSMDFRESNWRWWWVLACLFLFRFNLSHVKPV